MTSRAETPVELRGGVTAPALFCVHAEAGHVQLYRDLADLVAPGRVVYGLEAVSPDAWRDRGPSFEEMARIHLERVLAVSPEGPWVIVGECLGGALAYEIAVLLRARGDGKVLLLLVDAFPQGHPILHPLVPGVAYRAIHRSRILAFHARNLARLEGAARVEYATSRARKATSALKGKARIGADDSADAGARAAFREALAAYRPPAYDGPVWLFRASRLPLGARTTSDLGWGAFVEALEVEELPGYFTTNLSPPNVTFLADKLTARVAAFAALVPAPSAVAGT